MNLTLDRLLKATLDQYELPGLALGVTDDKKLIYSAAIGVRNIETKEPLQLQHVFHLASVSKPFVSFRQSCGNKYF